jgi:AcrR family transcriptional regulator
VTGVTSGLRARKKAQTAAAIEAAAMSLFAHDGFGPTTVPAIAAAADIAPRTFFRYFASKEDVLGAAGAARLELLVRLVEAEPQGRGLFAVLRSAMLTLAVEYERQREAVRLHAAVLARNPELRARGLEAQQSWESGLGAALAARAGTGPTRPSSLEIRLAAGVGVAALRAAVDEWVAEECSPDLSALVAEAFDLFAALERGRVSAGGGA